ncbi:DsbE family thiol:disulfide interchange protein [Luteimonas terrae]|uniref:DsbE family thiol:disulfide interchange protein n=1 Tax=Luteimonas terrae TaxID=1530191 RepID=A0A4R5UDW9_9GAMM|nr:DsbE family thiol:disulfide interchange protein [Luteimonas terrae]TDK33495.1 DsbE family thiol:disulfide interchange protein [Luteimonas terrae]
MTAPRSRARWLPLAAFGIVLMLLAAGVWLSRDPDRDALPSPLIGKPAPAFDLPVLGDPARRVTQADLRGAPYLLNVWGSWCPGCREEHAVVAAFAKTQRVRVIGFNWKDEPEDATRWLAQFGDPYALILADYDGRAAIEWGIYGAPETFLVDAAGTVVWKHVGPMTDATIRAQLLPQVERLEAR